MKIRARKTLLYLHRKIPRGFFNKQTLRAVAEARVGKLTPYKFGPKETNRSRRRYSLADLMNECDETALTPIDLQAWDRAAPVGREFGSADYERLEMADVLQRWKKGR